jgi:hypothetical protein
VNEAVAILQDGNDGGPGYPGYPGYPAFQAYPAFSMATYSPDVHGAESDTPLTGNGQPVVRVYRDLQFQPFSAG